MSTRGKGASGSLLDSWWAALHDAEHRQEYPEELVRRIAEFGDQLADHHLLDAECRKRRAAAARAIRAFARRNGVALPKSESVEMDPGPGPHAIELSAFDAGPCSACGKETGAGPVGWAREPEPGPLCDACFEQRCPPLAALLTQILSVREVGELESGNAEQKMALIGMLTTLGLVMQSSALEEWPPRPVDVQEMLMPVLTDLEQRDEVE